MTTDTQTSTPTDPVATETTDTSTATETAAEAGADETSLLGGAGKEAAEGGSGDPGEGGEAAGPPEAYEIALKDAQGNEIALDADALNEATPVLKELGLSNEAVNKLAPLAVKFMERGQQAVEAANEQMLAETKKLWLDEFNASELGGAKAAATLHTAAKAMDALGFTQGHPFRALLDATGFGNHPDMIATFFRLGSLLSEEGNFADPGGVSETKTVGHTDLYKDD